MWVAEHQGEVRRLVRLAAEGRARYSVPAVGA